MDDSKIFMFPDGGTRQTSNDVNSLLPLLMCNGGFGGGNWIWIIFLFFLYPLMRNGGLFGNMGQNCGSCLGPLANMVNNNDGRHFNRKLVEFATSKMTTRDSNGTEMALEPITREQLDNMMKQSNVHLTNNDNPYDAVFVANMCKADYLGSSVPDGLHLCLYVKDVIDDVDGYDGIAFNRWYADMCRKGIQVDWYNCR